MVNLLTKVTKNCSVRTPTNEKNDFNYNPPPRNLPITPTLTHLEDALQPVYRLLPVPTTSSTFTQRWSFSAGNKEKDKQKTYQAAPALSNTP